MRATARLEVRVRPEVKARIELAAELARVPVSDFVRSAAEEQADRVLAEHQTQTRVPADFFDALPTRSMPRRAPTRRWPRRPNAPARSCGGDESVTAVPTRSLLCCSSAWPSIAVRRVRPRGRPPEARARIVEATDIVAARFVVDALHEHPAAFYEHHGFTRIPDTLRLIQKISGIATALA
ncbi:MAG: DUF1778 domain-containing protein [Motilibacteraceae bacterium]